MLAVTGLTGKKSGGTFAEYLAENIDEIKKHFPKGICAIVRETSDTTEIEKNISDVQIHRGELTDKDFLNKSLTGVDTLVHIAGIHWSREIVTAAADCKVRRLILVHTTGIYSRYKEAGEEYRQIDDFVYDTCREHNITLTILRPTMIYGNIYDNNVIVFIKMLDKLPIMPVVNGARYELQPVYYRDLGKAYYDVLMHEKETANRDFNLSGEKPIMLREMLRLIGKNLGKEVSFFSVPFWMAYPGAVLLYLLTLTKIDLREKIQRLCEPRVYSHEEATGAFGYKPISFSKGVGKEVKDYLKSTRQ